MTKNQLRAIAIKLMEIGYYSVADYTRFCEKNNLILVF